MYSPKGSGSPATLLGGGGGDMGDIVDIREPRCRHFRKISPRTTYFPRETLEHSSLLRVPQTLPTTITKPNSSSATRVPAFPPERSHNAFSSPPQRGSAVRQVHLTFTPTGTTAQKRQSSGSRLPTPPPHHAPKRSTSDRRTKVALKPPAAPLVPTELDPCKAACRCRPRRRAVRAKRKLQQNLDSESSSEDDEWSRAEMPSQSFTSNEDTAPLLPGGQRPKTILLIPPSLPRTPARPLRLLQDVTSTLGYSPSATRLLSSPTNICISPLNGLRTHGSPRTNQRNSGGGKSRHADECSPESRRRLRLRARHAGTKGVPVERSASRRRRVDALPRLLLDARTVPERFAGARERIMGTRNYLRLFFPHKWQECLPVTPAPPPPTHAPSRVSASSSTGSEQLASQPTSPTSKGRATHKASRTAEPLAPTCRPHVPYFPQLTRRCRLTSNITLAQYISNVMGFMRDSYYRSADEESFPLSTD